MNQAIESRSGERLRRWLWWAALGVAAVATTEVGGQQPVRRVFDGAPAASWIAPSGVAPDAYGVFHFRREIELPARPERFLVHVSADNRYVLFVNGRQVSSGPQRSDAAHWRYETVDLAPHLRAGRNAVAAVVWNWGPSRPVAQHSVRTGFLLQASSEREAALNSGPGWKVLRNPAYQPIVITSGDVGGYYASPPGEEVDGSRYPWGWEGTDFDDSAWPLVEAGNGGGGTVVGGLAIHGVSNFGEAGGWQLVPRGIPAMEERELRLGSVRRANGIQAADGFLRGTGDLVIPAGTRATVLVDQAYVTNAYPVLETSGGAGSSVTLTYAEALIDSAGMKGHRDEIAGKRIRGVRDVFRPDGGEGRRFQTLWFRTYRYLQLDIETAGEPLRIHDLHGIFTGYPFQERGRFTSELPWLADMWEMNWRTARLDAWETYFDTPYYEQLQYVGDTRIQALISLYVGGDDRLVRQAIEHIDASRIPEGITASRYPSSLPQFIPPFSLIWVAMVHDYWMHRDDPEYVRAFLPGVRGVLGFFERHVDETGMLRPTPWWNFVDWAWDRGVPPGAADGHSALIALQYVYALQRAAELEDALGATGQAASYRDRAESVVAAVRERSWDPARRLFRDAPESGSFSQQTNVMALLVDAVPAADQRDVMERVLADTTLTQSTYYFSFYVLEALRKVGLGDRYIEQLAPWRGMLALGLTSTPEEPEPTRSDSHAWSAHPNYGLLATVLGVRPAAPGWSAVAIAPALGPLQRAEGRVPHPRGDIDLTLARVGETGLRGEVTLPPGVAGTLEWGGRTTTLRPGPQQIDLR